MVQSSDVIITRSGCMSNVRPACANDETALAEFFKHVTTEDMRFSFLTSLNEVGHDRLAAMTNVDHHQTESFLAFVDNETEIIATDKAFKREKGFTATSYPDDATLMLVQRTLGTD